MPSTRSQNRSSASAVSVQPKKLTQMQLARQSLAEARKVFEIDDSLQIFEEERLRQLEQHRTHPLMILIQKLKSINSARPYLPELFSIISKLEPGSLQYSWLSCNSSEHDLYITTYMIEILKIVCPNVRISASVNSEFEEDEFCMGDYATCEIENVATWRAGEMDEIVSNQYLFCI